MQWSDDDRLYLFLFGCMPLRAGIAYAAKQASPDTLVKMGHFAFIPALMFFLVFLTNTRQDKGAFGGKVWWNWTRPVHALFILLFAITASRGSRDSWRYLGIDTALGLGFFTVHRLSLEGGC